MVNLISGNVSEAQADVVVLPHSSFATVSESIESIVTNIGLNKEVPKADLGDVQFKQLQTNMPWKYAAFVCTVNGQSSYTAIFQIVQNLISLLPDGLKTINIPLIGTGAGQLEPENVYLLLKQGFEELDKRGLVINLYVLNDQLKLKLEKLARVDFPIKRVVFNFVVEEIKKVQWVEALVEMNEFYFAKAVTKFKEFENHRFERIEYERIADQFKNSGLVFSKFLLSLGEKTPEYKFLEICGQLVAYIDRNAYNKERWNEYDDKRTLARSAVNQTRWIENLIWYKFNGNRLDGLTPSTKNALIYLRQPSENLTMLSINHRQKTAQAFFANIIPDDLTSALGKFFDTENIRCVNPENNGSLYSRILYAPDIKYLWLNPPVIEADKSKTVPGDVTGSQKATSELVTAAETVKESADSAEAIRQLNLQMLMHSDIYAAKDLLNYETYDSILARLITSGLSTPPFNISIMAPWGKGKTTLMRFIQRKISKIPDKKVKDFRLSSVWHLIKWAIFPKKIFNNFKTVDNPVIWFNAWKFQKSEQIWAGLADEILRQLVCYLDPIDQEKFWFKLNLKN